MDLRDLQEAYLEYILGRFDKRDLAEYRNLFLEVCKEYNWDTKDAWQQARFEVSYIMNDNIPYNSDWEYISPLSGLYYKASIAVYPELERPGDFVLINNDWRIL